METTSCSITTRQETAWPLVGLLLDALTQRDFDAMQGLFATDIRFRALTPPGPFELHTANETAAKFQSWFGGQDDFEIVDASVGQVGSKLYARWRVAMSPTGRPAESRVVEQHVFTTGTANIETLDLLCSGFQQDTQ